ncbi:MAG: DUF362 domain-containing protein [Desulfuromonadales bacterium]|jgi:uncharacterized protein (DUF362 family)/NAD-dependent dihydropyrimidine dehydrogenase PreA subunit
MSRVSIRATSDYRRETIETALIDLLAPLGGMAAFVQPGQKVLVKPNMLAGKAPEKAVTTHPEVVRAVIRLAQQAGGVVAVGDSPGVGTPQLVAARCGILPVIEETGAVFAPFADSVKVRPQGKTFHELEIAGDLLDADVIINLPKLKTHQMMGLTCAVKNLFGGVVGMRKPRLHLQAGADKAFFALMLLELAAFLRPALNIVDAITAMEGNGPGSGDPVHVGALLAGAEALAVDAVAIHLLGLRQESVWTQRVALEKLLPGSRLDEVEIVGADPRTLRPRSFRPAKNTEIHFGLPAFLRESLKQSLTAWPKVDSDKCKLCGLCAEHCPPHVMSIGNQRLNIDYKHCIGCFCCQELCPHNALFTGQGLLLRMKSYLAGH